MGPLVTQGLGGRFVVVSDNYLPIIRPGAQIFCDNKEQPGDGDMVVYDDGGGPRMARVKLGDGLVNLNGFGDITTLSLNNIKKLSKVVWIKMALIAIIFLVF